MDKKPAAKINPRHDETSVDSDNDFNPGNDDTSADSNLDKKQPAKINHWDRDRELTAKINPGHDDTSGDDDTSVDSKLDTKPPAKTKHQEDKVLQLKKMSQPKKKEKVMDANKKERITFKRFDSKTPYFIADIHNSVRS